MQRIFIPVLLASAACVAPPSLAQKSTDPIADGNLVFEEVDGIVAVGQRWQTIIKRRWAWESRRRTEEAHDRSQPENKKTPAANGARLIRPPAGRLAIVADGNSPDPDDIGATAVIFGLLHASGLNDRLVHLSHSCDLKPTERIPVADERRRQKVLHQLCGEGVAQFGPFRNLAAYFNCRTHRKEAVADLRDAINHSSQHDPLWIIEAGEPDVIGFALQAADPTRRQFVHVVSHHAANDNTGDFFSWQQILDFGVAEHQIGDQNVGLKTDISPWDWAKNHEHSRLQWIWQQLAYAERDGVVKFQKNKFDCSDAGMVYWWITGASDGGNNHATPVEIAAMLRRVQPCALRVDENFVDALGFRNPSPVFSWKLTVGGGVQSQSAYQIVVTDASRADGAATPLWDSGKVASDHSAWRFHHA